MPRALKVEVSSGDAIRLALLSKGYTLKAIAKELGVTRGAVTGVIHGHWNSDRIWSRIASLLGRSVRSIQGRKALSLVSVTRETSVVNVRVSKVRRRRVNTGGERSETVVEHRRIA
jgi:predicted transcriptional regulator